VVASFSLDTKKGDSVRKGDGGKKKTKGMGRGKMVVVTYRTETKENIPPLGFVEKRGGPEVLGKE